MLVRGQVTESRAHAFAQGLLDASRKTAYFNSLWEVQS